VKNHHERENYSWELVQDMIEREVSSAFKLRTKPQQGPTKKEIKAVIRDQCRHHRKKKLKKNEYWSPNPFELRNPQL
jgi:hypothetical protein